MKLRQKAVHTNSLTGGGYSWRTYSGRYDRGWGSERTYWPYGAGWGYDSGGYSYSNRNWYDGSAWGQTHYGYDQRYSQSWNLSPVASGGGTGLATGTYGTPTIVFNFANITKSDPENNAISKYRIYTAYSTDGVTFGAWSLLAETTSTTYSWTVTNVTAGFYKVAVTIFDGSTWSALLNSAGTGWTAHQIENGNQGYATDKDTITYAVSDVFKIIHYTPPTWITDYYTVPQVEQIVEEIGKARSAFGLSAYTFSTANYIANFTIITADQMNEFHSAANDVYVAAKGSNYAYTHTSVISDEEIRNIDMRDMQDLLDDLS